MLPIPLLLLVVAAQAPAALARRVLVYVDAGAHDEGAETAAVLAAARQRGVDCMALWSEPTANALCDRCAADAEAVRRVREMEAPPVGQEHEWAARAIPNAQLAGVLCGSDGGLATAERLQHALLPARSNQINPARRDKYWMNEACRRVGMKVVAQSDSQDWCEAEKFLNTLICPDGGLRAVLKPRRGQEGVLVGLATSMAEAKAMHDLIASTAVSIESVGVGADRHCDGGPGVVMQELLQGDEWAVDTVSRNGEHKVVALWRYSKGPANGAPFVNFFDELRPVSGPLERSLVAYAKAALDALAWRWGPCHVELKATADGPRLVEVNAGRWNGVDFKLLVDIAVGYNAYDAVVSAYLDEAGAADDYFGSLPDAPEELRCHARLVKLVSSATGRLLAVDGIDEVDALESCVYHTLHEQQLGAHVARTVDLASCAGFVHLLHGDADVLQADYLRLQSLQRTMFVVDDDMATDMTR